MFKNQTPTCQNVRRHYPACPSRALFMNQNHALNNQISHRPARPGGAMFKPDRAPEKHRPTRTSRSVANGEGATHLLVTKHRSTPTLRVPEPRRGGRVVARASGCQTSADGHKPRRAAKRDAAATSWDGIRVSAERPRQDRSRIGRLQSRGRRRASRGCDSKPPARCRP